MFAGKYFLDHFFDFAAYVARRKIEECRARAYDHVSSLYQVRAGETNGIKDGAPNFVPPRRSLLFRFFHHNAKSAERKFCARPSRRKMSAPRNFVFLLARVKFRYRKAELFCEHYTATFFLPFCLRRLSTFLPPAVRRLLRKPCVLFLFLLLKCAEVLSIWRYLYPKGAAISRTCFSASVLYVFHR